MKLLLSLLFTFFSLTSYAQTADEWCKKAQQTNDANLKIEYADNALKLDPNNAYAYLLRGYGKDDLGRYQKAIEDFTEAIRLSPKYTNAYLQRANSNRNLGLHEQAIQDYDEAIRLDPNEPNTYYSRGNTKKTLKRHKEAIQDFNEAIRLNSKFTKAYIIRGNAKDDIGDYREAIEDFDEAIRLNPKDADIFYNRGIAKSNLDRRHEAITDYDEAIRLDPKYARAYYNRAISKKNLGKSQEAIADYDEVIRLDPKFASAYINRGSAKDDIGQYREAIEDFNEAIRLDSKNAITYNNRGFSKRNLALYQEAIYDFDEAIRLDPKYARAYINKGQCMVQLGRHQEALDFFTQGEALDKTITYHLKDKESATAANKVRNEPVKPTNASKRYAFIISNSAYKNTSSLRQQPANDASVLKSSLKNLGFNITELSEADTKADMEFAISSFIRKAKDADMLVAYYAGHGIEIKGVNYLLPTGVKIAEPDHAEIEAVRLDYVLNRLATCNSKISLVMLDACRDDPFANRPASSRSADEYRSFRTVESTPGSMLVMYAAEPGHKAANSGVFASAVKTTLVPGVKLTEFVQKLTKTVYKNTQGNQKPTLFGALLDEFEF